MQNELPEWAMAMAEQVAKEATRDAMRDPIMPYYITVAPHIAQALVTAERRGIGRAVPLLERLRHWIEDEVGAELPFTEEEQGRLTDILTAAEVK
ncbi:hypothetical protein [Devosia sp.]|uniref:hypothetical protein n=1 Tax=Devosia sp. TaxID=1871048 RepID=UPI002AFF9919|nr:hypothetical protein [Devosia sp.]